MTDGYNGGAGGQPTADDDPFAHLYRQEGGASPMGETAPIPPQTPGVPRTSYNHVRAVGERQYGQPTAHYAAPETYGGAPRQPYPPQDDGYDDGYRDGYGGGRRGGGGSQRNPLVLGAVAVVVTVVVAIAAAMMFGGDDEGDKTSADSSATASAGTDEKKDEAKASEDPAGELPKADAADLTLSGGAALGTEYPGTKSGSYVTGFTTPGATASWKVKIPADGQYYVYARFSVPGKDARLPVMVDGKPYGNGINFQNWAGAKKGEWGKWASSFITPTLDKGEHEITFYCDKGGDSCESAIDQVLISDKELGDAAFN